MRAGGAVVQTDYHERFAAVYDAFYATRDSVGECRLAAELLGLSNGRAQRSRVLDFGCGTGSHVLSFAGAGLEAVGFDVSPAMIAKARAKKPEATSAPVRFESGDFSAFCARTNGVRFDGATSFFNVLNCMTSPAAMLADLALLRRSLGDGAALLADVWNGAAVFADEPRPDVRHFRSKENDAAEIVRITVPELDRVNQRCRLRYRVLTLDRRTGRFDEFESLHNLHFLTPVQYRHLFELAGFDIADEFPKGRPGEPVTAGDWYISYLVRNAG
jgi:SAM-dependent methyltransferase